VNEINEFIDEILVTLKATKANTYEVNDVNRKSSSKKARSEPNKSCIQESNWANYFEKNIMSQLPITSKTTKSFIKDDAKTIFGNLTRFDVKLINGEASIDCYDNGTVSIKIYDFIKNAQIFNFYSPVKKRKEIEDCFNLLIDVIKFKLK
ncbi:hypothetical protein, partial [Acinetobacter indicus]|uniref:hypothetical protein n=1 Tax=Acinetobacter indicus TaxID=756892 RepID=UPI0014445A8F